MIAPPNTSLIWQTFVSSLALMLLGSVHADQEMQSIAGSWQGIAAKTGPKERVWLMRLELDPLQPGPADSSPLRSTMLKEHTPPGVSVLYLKKQLPLQNLTGTLKYLSTHHRTAKEAGDGDPDEILWKEKAGEIKAVGYIQPQTGRFFLNIANHTRYAGSPQFNDRAIHGFFNQGDQTITAKAYTESLGPIILQRPDAAGRGVRASEPERSGEVAETKEIEDESQTTQDEDAESKPDEIDYESRDAWTKQMRDDLYKRYETIRKRLIDDGVLTDADLQPVELPDWGRELLAEYSRPIRDRTADYRKRYPDRELSDVKRLANWQKLENDKLGAIASVNRDQLRDAKRAAQAINREKTVEEVRKRNVSIVSKISDEEQKIADPEVMTAWFEELKSILPDLDQESETYLRDAGPALFLLLSDDYFKRHFKKSYRDLSRGEAEAIRRTLRGYNKDVKFAPAGLRDGYPLRLAFEADQRRYYSALLEYLEHLNRYAQYSLESLGQLDPKEASTFPLTIALAGLAHHCFDALPPKQRQAFDLSLAALQTKLADETALHRAQLTINDHRQKPDYRIHLIDRFWSRYELLNRHVSKQGRAAADQIVDDYRDKIAQEAIAALRPRMAGLGRGITATDNGHEIYFSLRHDIGDAVNRPITQKFLKPLLDRRAKDLADAMPDLKNRLNNFDTAKETWRHVDLTLSLPGDQETPAAEELMAAANLRIAAIDRAAFETLYSKRELELMNDAGRIEVPAKYDPPTPDEIRLAMARELGQVWAGRTGPHSYRQGIKGITNVFIGGFIVDFRPVTVLATASFEDGYAAHYKYKAHAELEHGEKDWMANNPLGKVTIMIVRDFINHEVHEFADEFILTPQGWRSPTIRRRAIQDKMQFYQNMAQNLQRALPRYRFVYRKR